MALIFILAEILTMKERLSWFISLALAGLLSSVQAQEPSAAVTIGVDAKLFQFTGDWVVTETGGASGGSCLNSGPNGAKLPAATAIDIPGAGKYYLWVRAMDFPNDRPGTRTFSVSVGAKKSARIFGTSGKPGFTWEPGGAFDLPKGPVLLGIYGLSSFARADAILLTTDPAFTPTQAVGTPGHPLVRPLQLNTPDKADPLGPSPVTDIADTPVAKLENASLRIEYLPALREGRRTICIRLAVKTATGWMAIPSNPESEIYSVIAAGMDTQLGFSDFYPVWQSSLRPRDMITLETGGGKIETAKAIPQVIWNAGQLVRFLPRAASMDSGGVRLDFYPTAAGSYSAWWQLLPGEHTARVRLTFIPAVRGQYALGYHLFFRRPLSAIKEILLPPMWQRLRIPDQPRSLLDPFTPTPVALAETSEADLPVVWGVSGDPTMLPFQWPGSANPHFSLMIRENSGQVQPSIYGPVPGTNAARADAGTALQFSFRVFVRQGDWYAGYRTAADEVFRLKDYRSNWGLSLTAAALNMIDLVMDDSHGGWWDQAKAFYQIESKNGSSEVSPLTLLSLYRITGDTAIYRRRALPTMEFVLSRQSVHFSPMPMNTGGYDAGGMNGPVRQFGPGVYGGFWEMTQRRTSAFMIPALPAGDSIKPGPGGSHLQVFDEWLARYELTGDHDALVRACSLADTYLAQNIQVPPIREPGEWAFFFVSMVPDWEGLLRLYEATGKHQYLAGAVFGARQLMTGIWTQPLIPAGNTRVNAGGQFPGDRFNSWRGGVHYRLGTPRKPDDTPGHDVPSWLVSNIGLGFEQPSTLGTGVSNRLIYQMAWAPDFLRLAQYTGDKTFETYARNAVIGRWANYPGYYATGFTDLPLNPRYPYDGPDVTDIYYHHIAPHLAWTIDYLVAEAALRSAGRIRFPSLRQAGYDYFDTRVYGHAPGAVYDSGDVWLWLRRGIVTVDNQELNYITAHNVNSFFLILMNESSTEEKASVRFSPDLLKYDPRVVKSVRQISNGIAGLPLSLQDGVASVTVPPRELVVLELDHTHIDMATQQPHSALREGPSPGSVKLSTGFGFDICAAAMQVTPGQWDAYIWCTASSQQVTRVRLRYQTDDGWHQLDDLEYPFEFSIPVKAGQSVFRFTVEGTTPEGKQFSTTESAIAPGL